MGLILCDDDLSTLVLDSKLGDDMEQFEKLMNYLVAKNISHTQSTFRFTGVTDEQHDSEFDMNVLSLIRGYDSKTSVVDS